ncbi:hypothetical protein [Emticicia sp. 17c]|uniref:hypothetical protein n=1 Tax=Emticicia sp. 17c TaxID=3127704 RepID=UPI00301CCC1C
MTTQTPYQSSPYPSNYGRPMMPPPQGQAPLMYPHQGGGYASYGEPIQESPKSVWRIVLLVLGVLLTGGIAFWWWKKQPKESQKGLYELQQESIRRLTETIREQEEEIDRLNNLLREGEPLVERKAETSHEQFRDSFGMDLTYTGK